MADTTTTADRRRFGIPGTGPRPVHQPLWVLASVALVGVVLLSAAGQVDQAGPTAAAGLEAAQLSRVADGQQAATPPTPVASPTTAPLTASSTLSSSTTGSSTTGSSGVTAVWGTGEELAVGRSAVEAIDYPWEDTLEGWTVEFLPGQDGLYGLTLVPERRIEVYVRADQSPNMVAHVVAHELGHAIDVTLNDDDDRRRWAELRDLGDAPWWPDSGATDFSTGAGDFAESFAAWQVGPSGFRSTLALPPDGDQIELLAELSAG